MMFWKYTQSFLHDKSSFISQFIDSKSRDFQKWLRFLSEIVTSTFKPAIGGCGGLSGRGGWNPFGFGGGYVGRGSCGGLPSVFPTAFVLYLNDFPSEALSTTSSILSL